MKWIAALLAAALISSCESSPSRTEHESGGTDGLKRADGLGATANVDYFLNYDDEPSGFHNVFLMQSGRGVAVVVRARPTALNKYGGDEFWLWDVSTRLHEKGHSLPWEFEPTTVTFMDASGNSYPFKVKLKDRSGERVLRVEGEGSWFEVSVNGLLLGRTRQARRAKGLGMIPGLTRLMEVRGYEYYRTAELEGAGDRPVLPVHVVDPYTADGRFIDAEHPVGDTGWILVRWRRAGETIMVEKQVGGGGGGSDRTPEHLYTTLKGSCVTVLAGDGIGSGSVITTDGLVITNAHVATTDEVRVKFEDGRVVSGKTVARSKARDLALVRIQEEGLTPVQFDDAALKVGQSVVYIGAAAGHEFSYGSGHVAALRELEDKELIQLQAPVNPGNSGGPLFNYKGKQVGVIVSRLEKIGGRDVQNMGYAIPAKGVLEFIRENAGK